MTKLLEAPLNFVGSIISFVLGLALPYALSYWIRDGIYGLGNLYFVYPVILAVAWCLLLIGLCATFAYALTPKAPLKLKRYLLAKPTPQSTGLLEQFPLSMLSGLFIGVIFGAMLTCAAITDVLATHAQILYEQTPFVQSATTRELFVDLYFWHAIDMLPFIDIWKPYGVTPPITLLDFWGQSIVFLFRTAIVGVAASVFVQIVRFYRWSPQPK